MRWFPNRTRLIHFSRLVKFPFAAAVRPARAEASAYPPPLPVTTPEPATFLLLLSSLVLFPVLMHLRRIL
jgi:hypothetical protein